jgi:hypothetical protein
MVVMHSSWRTAERWQQLDELITPDTAPEEAILLECITTMVSGNQHANFVINSPLHGGVIPAVGVAVAAEREQQVGPRIPPQRRRFCWNALPPWSPTCCSRSAATATPTHQHDVRRAALTGGNQHANFVINSPLHGGVIPAVGVLMN